MQERSVVITEECIAKYRIVKELASSEFSTVFLVEHKKLTCLRVIKRINKCCRFHDQLMNEASILKNLKHPNIPIIYDMEEDTVYSYIIEEYLEGESLKAFCLYQNFIREDILLDITNQICSLFQFLHSTQNPILYLDLKPENIIVSHDRITLIDFGAAIYTTEVADRLASFGTIGYASPEQYGIQNVDRRSDIYGVGTLMYYMMRGCPLTNHPLTIKGMDPNNSYSLHLKRIILKCLKQNPMHRYQSMDEVICALQVSNKTKSSKNKKQVSSQPLKIAIAGAQQRIGTSHIGLVLTSYINRHYANAVFVERNESRIVPALVKHHRQSVLSGHILHVGDCPMLLESSENVSQMESFDVQVIDYGVLGSRWKDEVIQTDILLVVMGFKEWERALTDQKELMNIEYKEIYYLFNFVDASIFAKAKCKWIDIHCIRVPFHPNPFEVRKEKEIRSFVEKIWEGRFDKKKKVFFKRLPLLWRG